MAEHTAAAAHARSASPRTHRSLWVVGIFVVAGFVALYLQVTFIPWHSRPFGLFHNQIDLEVYRAGARHVLHRQPVYDGPVLGLFMYTYSPFSTLAFIPLVHMSHHTAVLVWSSLTVIALVASVLLCFKSFGYRLNSRTWVLAIAVAAVCSMMEPVRTTVWYGQVNVVIMALILWDLLRPGGSRLQGVMVGLTAGIKLTPALFAVYLLAIRRTRAAIIAVVAGVLTVAIGALAMPRASKKFWTETLWDSRRVGPVRAPSNQSITGALASILRTDSPPTGLWLLLAGVALVLGLTAAVVAYRRGAAVLALAIVGMTSTSVSPFSWGHHWVWFVPLAAHLVHLMISAVDNGRWVRLAAAVVAFCALYVSVFLWKSHYPHPLQVGTAHFREFYAMGLFMIPTPSQWHWFSAQPYLWVFGVTCVVTLLWWGPWRSSARLAQAARAVGARR